MENYSEDDSEDDSDEQKTRPLKSKTNKNKAGKESIVRPKTKVKKVTKEPKHNKKTEKISDDNHEDIL